jgi:hypothetical protein
MFGRPDKGRGRFLSLAAGHGGTRRNPHWVGRCRLTVSKPELKARLVSALETKI